MKHVDIYPAFVGYELNILQGVLNSCLENLYILKPTAIQFEHSYIYCFDVSRLTSFSLTTQSYIGQ